MFENIDIRRVENGFVVLVTTNEGDKEYIFENSRRLLRFLKPWMGEKVTNDE